MSIKALKGFKDILPDEVGLWQFIEQTARDIFHRYGFEEIKVPILEKTELFVRTIGASTDIVEKEMYTFADRNGSSITMRPEGTASVIRSYIENGLYVRGSVQRLYTIGPMFRHERPQKGRMRQFHQMSVEALGSNSARIDTEVMAMAWQILQEIGLQASLEINSLGCTACRPSFKEALQGFLQVRIQNLCEDCQRRSSTNPLRVLDCKSEHCQAQYVSAPSITDHLCGACSDHFEDVKQTLSLLAVPYAVNAKMVRGLDYYTRTTFELLTTELGAQGAIGAGGRYDGLVRQLGGPEVPGIGFAMGMERLVMLLSQKDKIETRPVLDLFLITLGETAYEKGFILLQMLRSQGLRVMMDHEGRSMKNQMKQADRQNAGFALILGENELVNREAVLKDMHSGEQELVELTPAFEDWAGAVLAKIKQLQ
ncbi:MAG: histidyl-tRNA synthetase [Desulfobacterales bacterium SG8_35]|nr:MAG: histidyl-tRNA synthetase [Desulfobacterales bacterium SG8_35]